MKLILNIVGKLPIVIILVLVIGVLSSFLDFGIISVFFSITMPLIFILNAIVAIYGLFKKKYFYLTGVVLFFLFHNFFYQFSSVSEIESKHAISLLTYNVKSFTQPVIIKKPESSVYNKINKFVDSVNPDVLIFQESSKKYNKLSGYPYSFSGYRTNSNKSLLSLFSKYPIINKGYIDFPNTFNGAIYADLKINQDTVRVYNVHLQSYVISPYIIANRFSNFNYWDNLNNTMAKQVAQAKLIKNHADEFNKNVIISGDFNATPYSQTYRTLKKGYNDSYINKGNGIGKTYSHRRYPLRLDYFLNNEQVEVVSHNNFDLNLSDHEPILVKFKIN